jgi:hypothetical protein
MTMLNNSLSRRFSQCSRIRFFGKANTPPLAPRERGESSSYKNIMKVCQKIIMLSPAGGIRMKRYSGYYPAALLIIALLCSITWGCGRKGAEVKHPEASPSPSPKAEVYSNTEVGYAVTYPPGWVRPSDANVGEFFAIFEKATSKPLPSFNIVSIEKEPYNLHDAVNQKDIKNEIEKDLKCAHEENVAIGGKPAYQIVFGLEKDRQSMIFKQTYVFEGKWLMVLTAACREDEFEKYEPEFDKILEAVDLAK